VVIVSLSAMWRLASRPQARVELLSAGLACCALEVEAAEAQGLLVRSSDEASLDTDSAADAPLASVLIVAGTVTQALEPAIARAHRDLARRGEVRVVAFGACSTSGGPYWDAPTVQNGIGRTMPVEVYVPGCPPRPQALIAELERLVDAMVEE